MKTLKALLIVSSLFIFSSCEVSRHGVAVGIGDDDYYYNNQNYVGFTPSYGYRYHNVNNDTYFYKKRQHRDHRGNQLKLQYLTTNKIRLNIQNKVCLFVARFSLCIETQKACALAGFSSTILSIIQSNLNIMLIFSILILY